MTKQQFKKHLTRLCELMKEQDKIQEVMNKSKLNDSAYNQLLGVNHYVDLTVHILKDAMDDEFDYIGYWLYELEMGKDYKKGCIKDGKKNIKLKTIDDLYKTLTI